MPSSSIKFAWAIPVPVVEFGAHLHAYLALMPTIETLRLANRFGRGQGAAIVKLPVELVQRIEAYLVEAEREERLQQRGRSLRCWEGQCEPIEHVPGYQIQQLRDERDDEISDQEDDETSDDDEHVSERDGETLMEFAERSGIFSAQNLHEEYFDPEDPEKEEEWVSSHQGVVSKWFRLARAAQADPIRSTLEKHFGLHAWIGHTKLRSGLKKLPCMRGTTVGSTITYLHIPVTSTQSKGWRSNYIEVEGETEQSSTVIAVAFSPDIPPVPTSQSLARFARAVKILGMPIDIATPDNTTALTEIREVVKKPLEETENGYVEAEQGNVMEDQEHSGLEEEENNDVVEGEDGDVAEEGDSDVDGWVRKEYQSVRPSLQALSLFEDVPAW